MRSDPATPSFWGDGRLSCQFRGGRPITWRDRGAGRAPIMGPSLRRSAMGQHYVGLDVSLEMTSVCVLDEAGAIVWRGKVASTPEAIAAAIRAHAPQVAR